MTIETQERLMQEWFDGKHVLKIEKADDKKVFLQYISFYDLRNWNYAEYLKSKNIVEVD